MKEWSPEQDKMFGKAREYLRECYDGRVGQLCEEFNKEQNSLSSGLKVFLTLPYEHVQIVIKGVVENPPHHLRSVKISNGVEYGFLNEKELDTFSELTTRIIEEVPYIKIVRRYNPLSLEERDKGPLTIEYQVKPIWDNFQESSIPSELKN